MNGVATSQERTADACGVCLRTIKLKRKTWQHRILLALSLSVQQTVTHTPYC